MRTVDGHGFPPRHRRILDGVRLRALAALRGDLTVGQGPERLRFRCDTADEYNRVTHVFHQEPGTVEWLRATVRDGDVFHDIGANIGIFTLLAAHRVGPAGRVCAFEPHAGTLTSLMHNVVVNGHADAVDVVGCALHDESGWLPFHYRSLGVASGLSQLGATIDPHGRDQPPVVSEWKPAVRVDDLVADGVVRSPTVVKIDVDGNEPAILRGMSRIFAEAPPRSVQVEINPAARADVEAFFTGVGYRLVGEHRSRPGASLIASGADPATVGVNGIFEPAG